MQAPDNQPEQEASDISLNEMFTAAYEELRRLASLVRLNDPRATINPTALVNEAWLKLARSHNLRASSDLHFKRIAARAMRQVLVEAARRRSSQKRGGEGATPFLPLEDLSAACSSEDDFLRLNEALTELELLEPRQAALVEGRFFGGLDVAETAVLLNVSEATIHRDWRSAKAWLKKQAEANAIMTAEQFRHLQHVFHGALALSESERTAYVESACGGDASLIASVLLMLEEDAADGSLLDGDVGRLAHDLLVDSTWADRLRQCGPYRLKKKLGEGGMGVVYLAERDDLGALVAIKILRDFGYSTSLRERFAHEQRILAQLTHPFIARLYDAGILPDGTPWFVMEYVDGVPVSDYCRKQSCTVEACLQLFRSICEAVQYAHEHAVIHRDLKPSNILVTADGGVRLLDFGIAKHLETSALLSAGNADQTRTEMRFLTPAYAAPEQILGQSVGIYTDVYALGLILYELLTGSRPFDLSRCTPGEAERLVVQTNPEKPSAAAMRHDTAQVAHIGRNAWADLDVLCLTALQKEPGRRYRSVEALIRDVDHYLRREPLEARSDSIRYRAGKFILRNRGSVFASALTLSIIAGLVLFFTLRVAAARNAAVRAAARTERVQSFVLNLFQGGDASAAPAENLKVLTLVDRGVQEAQTLTSDPDVQAQLFLTLGGIYQKLGKFDRADSLLQSALNLRRRHEGTDGVDYAGMLIAVGLLRLDQGRFDEAEKLVRQGRDKIERLRPPDKEAGIKAAVALAKVLEARGAYLAALPLLEQAAQFQSEANPPTLEFAATLKELADVHYYVGHDDLCESLTNQAMVIHRRLLGDRHPLVADDLINLGGAQSQRGNYPAAEALYRKALVINEEWYGRDSPQTASNLYMLGQTMIQEKKFDEAETLLHRALSTQERVYGPNHPHVANVLNELCAVASQRDRYNEAQACFERAVNIYKAAYGERHSSVAIVLGNLANVHLDKKEYPQAERLFREVIARYKNIVAPDPQNVGIAEIKLGRTLLKEKKYAEAREHTQAGYDLLANRTVPSISWLQAARKDLAASYEALGDHRKAVQYLAERAKFAQ